MGAGLAREIIIPYSPRDAFRKFHKRTERWACLVAHRRAGKTVACINDLIRRAFLDGKAEGRYAYIAPFYRQAKSIAWDYLLKFSEPVRVNANASELWVELLNGARIRLFGADNPDSLRGLYLDGVILDEYADMRPRVWGEIIRPLLADREGWAVFIGTPKGHNGFYEIWRTAQASDSWYAASVKASLSGILPTSELSDAKRGMTEDQYEQEFECSFEAAILGAYYGKELRQCEQAGRVTTVEYDPNIPVYTAWDLGYHDDTAIWFYQVTHTEIHCIDYYAASGLSIEDYAKAVNTRGYRYEKHWLPHDARAKTLASGGRSIIEQLIPLLGGAGKLAIVPSLSVQDGIQAVRFMMPRVWFDRENCGDAVEILKQYQREYDEDKKVFREKPRHDSSSHCADAFRMLALSWKENKPKEPEKELIFHIKAGNNGIIPVPLDELWRETPRRTERY
jgi:phage terminase large subunit